MKYLGVKANKILAYGVASVSGTILAVCSCTVLPLFAGIYKMGAGLGPAIAFLYSGPAINVLAIVLTARILGMELGIARAVGAIVFSVLIGILMHLFFRKDENEKSDSQFIVPSTEAKRRLWQNAIYFALMVGILVFANFGKPDKSSQLVFTIYNIKWIITSLFAVTFGVILVLWFEMKWWKVSICGVSVFAAYIISNGNPIIPFAVGVVSFSIFASTDKGETGEWFASSWGFAKQIFPLLFIGVLAAGFLLGRVGYEGIIPSEWVTRAVGGNSFKANFLASFAGAFMYFATLTEVPILQGLIENGMGKGPALALLLAGPALSLPNMLVIRSVIGTKKTITFISLVIILSTFTGMIFGAFFK